MNKISSPTESPHGASGAASTRLLKLDGAAWFFIFLAAASAVLVLCTRGAGVLVDAAMRSVTLLMTVMPMIVVGLLLGGLVKELSDPERIAPVLGKQSGWKGLVLATALGAATPGGPFAAFPIVYAFWLAGADIGAVVAYLTAWSVLAVHRLVVWELPLLGVDFVLVRSLASLPLPIAAGYMARLLFRLVPNMTIGRAPRTDGGE